MKTAILFAMMSVLSWPVMAQTATMIRVDKLTDAEKKELADAEQKVAKAQKEADDIRKSIAVAHKMKAEDWMEWQTYVDFDGGFIVLREHNSMDNGTFAFGTN